MTNYEKIKNMSVEDIAHDLNIICYSFDNCYQCPFSHTICSGFYDLPDWIKWLESEAE